MNVVKGLGIDQAYLERGRAAAKKILKGAYKESEHPVTPDEVANFSQRNYESSGLWHQGYYHNLMQAFLWRYGQHSIQINPQTWLFETIPVDRRIPRPQINLVGDKVRGVVGEILKNQPKGLVMPKDSTPLNRRGAQIGQAKLSEQDEIDEIEEFYRLAAEVGTICGDAYAEVVVDHSNAATAEIPMFAEVNMGGLPGMAPVLDESGQQVMETIKLAQETTNLITPLQIFFNRFCRSLKTSTIAHSHCFQPIDWCQSQWPDEAPNMRPTPVTSQAGHFQTRLMNLMYVEGGRSGMSSSPYPAFGGDHNAEACLVHVIRMNPDSFYERGRYFVVAGGKTVVSGPLPFGKLMLVHFRYSPIPNSMISYGLVKDLIGINAWIEQMAHQGGMQRRTLGIPFVMAHKRAGGHFAGGDLPMKYGAVYTYEGQNKPEVVYPHGTMDAGFVKEMEFWLHDFLEQVSGLRRGMQGDRPTGVYSGVLLRQMAAWGSIHLIPMLNGWSKFVEQLNCLRLEAIAASPAAQIPSRLGFATGASKNLWMEFSASDMRDNVTYKIETGSSTHTDEATQMNDIVELTRLGYLNPMDAKTRQAVLRKANLSEVMNQIDPNVQKANDENAELAAGGEVEIGPFENDPVHLQVHVDWINSPHFGLMDPQRQEMTILHAKDHEDRIKARLMEAAAAATMPLPGPGFRGSPMPPEAGPTPANQVPGNGIPGTPQTSIAAQQAPSPETSVEAA